MKRPARTHVTRSAVAGLCLLALGAFTTAGCRATPHQVAPPTVINPSLADIARLQHPTRFVGEGRLSHSPEYIELTVTIHAECYQTPMAANRAADEAAAAVMTVLRGAIDANSPKDGVFSGGGFSRPFSRYEDNRTVCRDTFAKTTTVTMKTSRLADFAARYPNIQQQVLTRSLSRSGSDRRITYATLSVPKPQLYYETRERLEQRALADALTNARQKFEATAAAGCGPTHYGILRVTETDPDAARPIAYARARPSRAAGSALELDAIWINKLLDVAFTTEPGACKVRATAAR